MIYGSFGVAATKINYKEVGGCNFGGNYEFGCISQPSEIASSGRHN
jgi:hypothetical protein